MKILRFFAYFSAFLSLTLSLAIIGYWIFADRETKDVDLGTFVGVTVALLGIIVTLAIAWQIYNAVEMRSKVEELKQLEGKFEEHKQSFKQEMHSDKAILFYLTGIGAFRSGSMLDSFRFIITALENTLQTKRPINIAIYLDKMESAAKNIASNTKYEAELYDEVDSSNKTIQSLGNYELIKDRYEPIYKMFSDKVIRACE